MSDCIFCRVIAGELPCYKIYEDENFLAILDILPHALGQTLVIPKKHYANFIELDNEVGSKLFSAVQQAMNRIVDVLHPIGFNVGWNENAASGQTIPHLHILIFPRYENDGGRSVHSIIKNPGTIPVSEVSEKFNK